MIELFSRFQLVTGGSVSVSVAKADVDKGGVGAKIDAQLMAGKDMRAIMIFKKNREYHTANSI